jgi:hypothetical protein
MLGSTRSAPAPRAVPLHTVSLALARPWASGADRGSVYLAAAETNSRGCEGYRPC